MEQVQLFAKSVLFIVSLLFFLIGCNDYRLGDKTDAQLEYTVAIFLLLASKL